MTIKVVGYDQTNGQLKQVEIKDTGVQTLTNNETATVAIGRVIRSSGSGAFSLAQANAWPAAKAIGLAGASINAAATGEVVTGGVLTATTAEWDAVAGTVGGLTAGSTYFLSPTVAGGLTTTVPVDAGQWSVIVGEAISATEFKVEVQTAIGL